MLHVLPTPRATLIVAAGLTISALTACSSPTYPSMASANASTAAIASASTDSAATTAPAQTPLGNKPINTVPATITFADRSGDAITSNGSSYAAEILSGSTLEFACCAGQVVNYNFSAVISGPGPTGTLSDPSGFFVNNVGSMAIGSTMLAKAYFKTSIGQINFDSAADGQTNSVFVTRVDANTWTVDTSAGDIGVLVQNATMPDPNNPHKTITVTSKTYYHLTFKATGVLQ
jgi:hypothetical protein